MYISSSTTEKLKKKKSLQVTQIFKLFCFYYLNPKGVNYSLLLQKIYNTFHVNYIYKLTKTDASMHISLTDFI